MKAIERPQLRRRAELMKIGTMKLPVTVQSKKVQLAPDSQYLNGGGKVSRVICVFLCWGISQYSADEY